MSKQSGEQYSHDALRKQIDNVNVGGPPLGCTGSNQELFNQVQNAAECACASEGTVGGPLCDAISAGRVMKQKPFSCMVDLIEDYSDCNKNIPENKRKAAYKAFSDVTGYKQANLNKIFSTVDENFDAIANFNSFYMFMPTMILLLIIIWLMVGFRWINWVLGLFFSSLVFVVLYGFSVMYRIHFQNYINSKSKVIQNQATLTQQSFENSIAYWPQGLFAAACAVTNNGQTGSWSCNDKNPCPPCNDPRISRYSYQEDEDDDEDDDDDVVSRKTRRKRNHRRKNQRSSN